MLQARYGPRSASFVDLTLQNKRSFLDLVCFRLDVRVQHAVALMSALATDWSADCTLKARRVFHDLREFTLSIHLKSLLLLLQLSTLSVRRS